MTQNRTRIIICAIVCITAVLLCGKVFRHIRDEAAYRLPFVLPGTAPCPDCNILLVNLDTLRADELSCFGYARNPAPDLCDFAGKNIYFTRFYTQSTITLDSHMSIFTGLYPSAHHVIDAFKDTLNPRIPMLTETLRKHGYRTVYAGVTDDILLPFDKGLERGFSEIHTLNGSDPDWKTKYESIVYPRLTGNQPVFIFLHTYAPHAPYLVGDGPYTFVHNRYIPELPLTQNEFRAHSGSFYAYVIQKFRDRLAESDTPESKERNAKFVRELGQSLTERNLDSARNIFWKLPAYEQYDIYMDWYWKMVDKKDPKAISYVQDLFDERIFQLNGQIKSLLTFLERPEIKRKTIVIFFSDNGEAFMEHGNVDHGNSIYNEETHTPFILSAPRLINGVYRDLTQAVDFFPTILDLVGVPLPAKVDGRSLKPLLTGEGSVGVFDPVLISQHRGDEIVSVQNRRWKMYRNNTAKARYLELYDLLTDPKEQFNVLGEHMEVARQLDVLLHRSLDASPKYASLGGEFPAWIDPLKRKALMEEGYF